MSVGWLFGALLVLVPIEGIQADDRRTVRFLVAVDRIGKLARAWDDVKIADSMMPDVQLFCRTASAQR